MCEMPEMPFVAAGKSSQLEAPEKSPSALKVARRDFVRKRRPAHSRSWAPAEDTAPKGWYKTDVGPANLRTLPGKRPVTLWKLVNHS